MDPAPNRHFKIVLLDLDFKSKKALRYESRDKCKVLKLYMLLIVPQFGIYI